MKICLLTCSAPFLIDERVFPPLGLMTVGTALSYQGHDVTIADSPDGSTSYCFAMGPTTPEYADAVSMLRRIKRRPEASRVVIGGPHATANAKECLADGFDVVAIGDGENITAKTFEAAGVVNLGRGSLDRYPIADRGLVDIHSYRYEIDRRPATTLVTSRGCPYRCGFCANTDRRVRFYRVARIEAEIVYLMGWGYRALMIFDDVFIFDKERTLRICAVLDRHEIVWRCFVRGDLVVHHGQELVDAMAESGCVEVAIGIESGSDRILTIVHKGERLETIRSAIGMLKQAGIRVKGLFIVGLPGEDQTSLEETRRFTEEVALDAADFTVYQPYRGSPIWNDRHDYDIHWADVPAGQRFYKGRSGEYKCSVSTGLLTRAEIVEARDSLERSFRNGNSQ